MDATERMEPGDDDAEQSDRDGTDDSVDWQPIDPLDEEPGEDSVADDAADESDGRTGDDPAGEAVDPDVAESADESSEPDAATGRSGSDSGPDDDSGAGTGPEDDVTEPSESDLGPGAGRRSDGGDDHGPIGAFLHSDDPVVETIREIASSVGVVLLLGLVLFAISGVWPPLVAVESGSMEPHMHKGDLVFVMEAGRFSPGTGPDAAIVTHHEGRESGYWSFGDYGNVVVYEPDGRGGTPIIHRAMFYVEEGDDWVAMANESHLRGIDSCSDVPSCPAPHDGYVTKGDANGAYDQAVGRSSIVRPSRIRGVAKVRVPLLGCIRLELAGNSCLS